MPGVCVCACVYTWYMSVPGVCVCVCMPSACVCVPGACVCLVCMVGICVSA